MKPTRRDFILGSLSGLTLPRLGLALPGAAAGLLGPRVAAANGGDDKFLVVVVVEGGWDVTFAFDPKYHVNDIEGPDIDPTVAADEGTETWGNITIAANPVTRPSVSAWFERWHQRACVVNGIWMGSIAHDPCRVRILTGTADVTRPDMATIMGYELGQDLPLGSVDLSGWSITGPLASSAGRVGTNSQLKALIDPDTTFNAPSKAVFDYPIWRMDGGEQDAVAAWLRGRTERYRAEHGGDLAKNDRLLDDLLVSNDRAARFRDQSSSILESLTLGSTAGMDLQVRIAADLLEAGLCRAVTLDSRKDWDTHDGNAAQHGYFEGLFQGLETLASEFQARGLLDRTVVAVVSEMTRTPKLNGAAGKDHWGHTSALLFGAVKGNQQIGGTDDLLESLPVDLETGMPDAAGAENKYDNFCAGLLELVGVDPGPWLRDVKPWRGAKV